jgi:hypothetical protein
MTNIELIEAAAAAARIGGGWELLRGASHPTFWRDEDGNAWRPLDDDGDALRLAVKLEITLRRDAPGVMTAAGNRVWEEVVSNGDDCAATRRAIVRAAAAMARYLK